MKIAVALIAFGLALLFWGVARAGWQIHDWDGEAWAPARTPRGYIAKINLEKSACEMDLVNLLMARSFAARLQCKHVP